MLSRLIVESCRAGRKAATPIISWGFSRLKGWMTQPSENSSQRPTADAPAFRRFRHAEKQHAVLASDTMQDILAERLPILEQIAWAAEQGMVPDAAARLLLLSYEAELAEHRRLLAEDKLALQAGLHRLAALFPLPPAPEPEPPEPPKPPRRREFSPLGGLLAKRPKGRAN